MINKEQYEKIMIRAVTPKQFAEIMQMISEVEEGTEYKHRTADFYMCEILRGLGYKDGIEIFEKMEKWYA